MDSILKTVRIACNVDSECTDFDEQLIPHINFVFMNLKQMGIGPEQGFFIINDKDMWDDFIDDEFKVETVKSYVGNKVHVMFDPPNGSILESLNRIISEQEWRLTNDT